jgi:hypothetical protein
MGDLIDLINSRGLKVKASVNANGDGLVIKESLASGETAGTLKVKVEEVSGSIAKNLNVLGTASAVGTTNYVDGSFERKVTLTAADTLQATADKINAAKVGVTASVVRDGSGSAPFRLNITSTQTGSSGRFIMDSGSIDLGMSTLDQGRDARIFFGSNDAATGVAVTSSTNTIDTILQGVKIDLKSDLFTYDIDAKALARAQMMDGKLLLVTNVADLEPAEIVQRYKSLADIERGFRVLKSEIEIAPVYHRLPERIRAHASICFMALILYRVMRQRLKAAGHSASPESALAQLRKIQRQSVAINQGVPVSGISNIHREQADLLAAMNIRKPVPDAQLSLL